MKPVHLPNSTALLINILKPSAAARKRKGDGGLLVLTRNPSQIFGAFGCRAI